MKARSALSVRLASFSVLQPVLSGRLVRPTQRVRIPAFLTGHPFYAKRRIEEAIVTSVDASPKLQTPDFRSRTGEAPEDPMERAAGIPGDEAAWCGSRR